MKFNEFLSVLMFTFDISLGKKCTIVQSIAPIKSFLVRSEANSCIISTNAAPIFLPTWFVTKTSR